MHYVSTRKRRPGSDGVSAYAFWLLMAAMSTAATGVPATAAGMTAPPPAGVPTAAEPAGGVPATTVATAAAVIRGSGVVTAAAGRAIAASTTVVRAAVAASAAIASTVVGAAVAPIRRRVVARRLRGRAAIPRRGIALTRPRVGSTRPCNV